ncbi:hypothetical protein KFE98_19640 [bacterium SCSIO 12741]|nr:hypothetical protein KFE98_19640 [bacterium SCSIO 12741]
MVQPGRTYNHGAYRYGFLGQEYDREWKNGATSSQVPDYFYVDVMDNDLVFEDDFNDLSQWTVSNHGNGSCASLGAGGGLVLDTEDAWCGVQSVEFDVESGKSYWLGIDVDKPASHAGAEVVVIWDYWDAGNNQWYQLGVLVVNQTGRHSTGMWRATGSTKLRMRLLPGGNVSSSNPCKATFYGIAVREQLTNWTTWHNSQGDLNLIGQGGRLRLQNDQNSGGGHSKEIAITNKGVPHTVTYNVERVTPNDANNNYSCHIIIEHRDAGGSWTELDYSARYISYDPEIKTITKAFTPTKDYIRFYVTSISSNPYPAPIEFYMDNIRITDGSTVPIASNGGGDMVAFKYRMHDPHIGRFLSLDPLAPKYPHNSPFAFAENSVIAFIELEGLEKYYAANGKYLGQFGTSTDIRIITDRSLMISAMSVLGNGELANKTAEIKYSALNTKFLDGSTRAYLPSEEMDILRDWSVEYQPKSKDREYAMVIYSGTLVDENGDEFTVLMPGTTVEGKHRYELHGGGEVDPDGSVLRNDQGQLMAQHWQKNVANIIWVRPFGGDWKRYSMIHSHFEGLQFQFSPGDIDVARGIHYRTNSHLIHYNHNSIKSFNLSTYERLKDPNIKDYDFGTKLDENAMDKAVEETKNFITK